MITTNNGSFPWRDTPLGMELERARSADGGAAELRAARDRVARQSIALQAAAGCDLPTDGLARRPDPIGDLVAGLAGIEPGEERTGFPGRPGISYRTPIVTREVGWTAPFLVEDYLFAAQGAPADVRVVITGPLTLATVASDRAYGDPMALAMALAIALNQELRALHAAGARHLQVDEPALLERPESFPHFTRVFEVLGRGLPPDLTLHLEGGALRDLTQGLLRLKRLGCLSVDCVSVPANLATLAGSDVPPGVRLGLGLVDGGTATVEDPAILADRVRSQTRLSPFDRLLFGTGTDLGGLPSEIASRKLASLAAARRILQPA